MHKLYILVILFIVPLSLSAKEDTVSLEVRMFQSLVWQAVSLSRSLSGDVSDISREKIFQKRDALMSEASHLYEGFALRAMKKMTLDTSSKYKLTLQKYKLSCEVAALRIVIESVTWKYISEERIISRLPVFPLWLSDAGIWWDPEREFVGSYTGSQRNTTGYGIYEAPLAKYLSGISLVSTFSNAQIDPYLMPADRLEKWLEAIHSGASVILWGDWCTTSFREDGIVEKIDNYVLRFFPLLPAKNTCERPQEERIMLWNTPDGWLVRWVSWEHAFVLLGYMWPRERPTHVIVWDTDTGKHIYRTSEWMRKWSLLDYRTLIVRPKDIGGI